MNLIKASAGLAGLAGAALLFATPAAADGPRVELRFGVTDNRIERVDYGRHHYQLPFWQVRQDLRHRGFRRIQLFREGRNAYVVDAIGRRGSLVRIRVDKYSGQILNIRRDAHRAGPGHGGYLSPREARFILRDRGFRRIHFVRERARAHVFEATGPGGFRVRVAVDKFTGRIERRGRVW